MIPKMRITGKIRSNTVNGYNTVYHYSQSVNPGQSGECGLLSHRTKYSGLFSKLGSLEAGDEVIITDYLLHRKYVYIVRWNYKKKPLTFAQSGDAKLLLITCYPPGKSEAAFITHCKLVSTTILAN
jgi:sortase A